MTTTATQRTVLDESTTAMHLIGNAAFQLMDEFEARGNLVFASENRLIDELSLVAATLVTATDSGFIVPIAPGHHRTVMQAALIKEAADILVATKIVQIRCAISEMVSLSSDHDPLPSELARPKKRQVVEIISIDDDCEEEPVPPAVASPHQTFPLLGKQNLGLCEDSHLHKVTPLRPPHPVPRQARYLNDHISVTFLAATPDMQIQRVFVNISSRSIKVSFTLALLQVADRLSRKKKI